MPLLTLILIFDRSGGFLCVGCPKLFPPPTTTLKRSGDRRRNRRAALDSGPAYDGSQGVDSEDILGIPQIGFSSFQLFPDQDSYATSNDPGAPSYSSTVRAGVEWIETQAQAASQCVRPCCPRRATWKRSLTQFDFGLRKV